MALGKVFRTIETEKNPDSLLPIFDKAVLSQDEVFSWGRLRLFNESLTDAIDNRDLPELFSLFSSFQAAVYGNPVREKSFIHTSEVLRGCPRKMYYDLTGVEHSNPSAGRPAPQLQMIFDFGTWIHSYVQMLLFRAGALEGIEVPFFNDEFMIGGKADGILKLPKRRLLEIKSSNSNKFRSLKTAADSDHVTQASVYAKNLGIDEIHILYINKDNCEVKEFVTPLDLVAVERVEKIASGVVEAVKVKKPPERICLNTSSAKALTCKYCTHCFKS